MGEGLNTAEEWLKKYVTLNPPFPTNQQAINKVQCDISSDHLDPWQMILDRYVDSKFSVQCLRNSKLYPA